MVLTLSNDHGPANGMAEKTQAADAGSCAVNGCVQAAQHDGGTKMKRAQMTPAKVCYAFPQRLRVAAPLTS